jgi:hypothetical protein
MYGKYLIDSKYLKGIRFGIHKIAKVKNTNPCYFLILKFFFRVPSFASRPICK